MMVSGVEVRGVEEGVRRQKLERVGGGRRAVHCELSAGPPEVHITLGDRNETLSISCRDAVFFLNHHLYIHSFSSMLMTRSRRQKFADCRQCDDDAGASPFLLAFDSPLVTSVGSS